MSKVKMYAIVAFSLVLATGGISYGMTGHAVPFSGNDTISLTKSSDATPKPKKSPKPEKTPKPDRTPKPSKSPKPRSTDGCPEGFTGNHGQFVKQSDDKEAAAHSECGKPLESVKDDSESPEPSESPEIENEQGDDNDDQGDDHGTSTESHGHGHGKEGSDDQGSDD